MAGLLRTEERWERAARLFAAAAALRESIGVPVRPVDRPEYEAHLAALRESLGPEAFTAAWEAGRAMSWEEAVAYALEEEG